MAFAASIIKWSVARPAEIFLIAAAFFGTLFCFVSPPLNGSDEFTHFPRAYSIQNGQLWPHRFGANQYGDFLPVGVVRMVDDYRDLSRKSTAQEYRAQTAALNTHYWTEHSTGNQLAPALFSSSAPYSPWSFTPAVAGIAAARAINAPLVAFVYISRFFTLLAWLALTYLAIKLLPGGKWFLVAVALLPTSLLQAATIGPDALVNGVSWLLIALSLAFFVRTRPVNAAALFSAFILALALCTTKQGYWLLAALPFFIPANNLPRGLRLAWRVVAPAVLIAVSALYTLSARPILQDGNLLQRTDVYVNSHAQLDVLLNAPTEYLGQLITQPFSRSYDTVYTGLVGMLGNRQIQLPMVIAGFLYLALVVFLAPAKPVTQLKNHRRRLRTLVVVIFIGTYAIISTMLYLSFTPVGRGLVEGMQGRYFLPLLPLLLVFPLAAKKTINLPFAAKLAAASVIILALTYACFVITT